MTPRELAAAPRPPRFAVVIPAHNEEAVIEQKIHASHALRFPPLEGGLCHLMIVVDDHSTDATARIARDAVALLPERADLEWRVIDSTGEPGKGGALRTGFEEGAGFDLLAITDADSLVDRDAPLATAYAFRDPRVGVVSGSQRYVESIGALDVGPPRADFYDRASESVRRFESSLGALFSVHGPWLVLRAATGARPNPGVGADDLDLALAAREAGWRSVLSPDAVFYEVKPSGAALAAQRERRARAYFEALDRHLPAAWRIAPRPLGLLQLLVYAAAPPLAALSLLGAIVAPTAVVLFSGSGSALAAAAALATAGVVALAPRLGAFDYAFVILRARFSARRTRADRWVPVARPGEGAAAPLSARGAPR